MRLRHLREGNLGTWVVVQDDDYPGIMARFLYRTQPGKPIKWLTVEIGNKKDDLTAGLIHSLPIGKWERTARSSLIHPGLSAQTDLAKRSFKEALAQFTEQQSVAESMIDNPQILEAVLMYRLAVSSGERAAANTVAREMGVNPSTVRSWLHRARKAGLLGPARRGAAGETALQKPKPKRPKRGDRR